MATQTYPSHVVLGLIQTRCLPDSQANLERAIKAVRQAARRGARIVCLPELFQTRYFPQTKSRKFLHCAERIPGPVTKELSRLAQTLKIVLIAPVFEKVGTRLPSGRQGHTPLHYNTAVVIDADGSILGKYRKLHLPNDPHFCEKFYFAPGDLGVRTFSTRYAQISVLICWDQWFPEAARLAALSGTQIVFYPTAIGWHRRESLKERRRQLEAWQVIQRAHAIANGVYVAAVNRVGREDNLTFWGSSFVAGPFGEVLGQASQTKEEILIVPCDLKEIAKVRRNWPFLQERRVDAYGSLLTKLKGNKKRCQGHPLIG